VDWGLVRVVAVVGLLRGFDIGGAVTLRIEFVDFAGLV
jgi:hypothetical protein